MYYSFIMLKPDALERGLTQEIIGYLKQGGIEIEWVNYMQANRDIIFRHYAEVIEKYGEDFKEKAAKYFDGRFVLPVIVKSEDKNVITRVREIVGATDPVKAAKGTIRGDLGTDSLERSLEENRCCENLIHASDCPEAFETEIQIWFAPAVTKRYIHSA